MKKRKASIEERIFAVCAVCLVPAFAALMVSITRGPDHHHGFGHAAFAWKTAFYVFSAPAAFALLAICGYYLLWGGFYWLFTGEKYDF